MKLIPQMQVDFDMEGQQQSDQKENSQQNVQKNTEYNHVPSLLS